MFMNYPYQQPYTNYQPKNGINWVQGVEGAKAYQLSPNSNAMLLDSENDGIFYIKISDNVGMCTLRTFQYKEIQSVPDKNSNYITRDEFEAIKTEMTKLNERLNNEHTIPAVEQPQQQQYQQPQYQQPFRQ